MTNNIVPPVPAKLLEFAEHIREIRPEDHAVEYSRAQWDKHFSGDPDYSAIAAAHPEQLRRGDLFDLASLKSPSSTRQLFIGAMLWGFGTDNRGAAKTRRSVDFPNLAKTLEGAIECLARRKYLDAYNCNDIPECGPAFFSKFLYFAGECLPIHPKPMILDSRVAGSLERMLGSDGRKQLVWGNTDENGRVWVMHGPDEYVNYIHALDQWAAALACKPDSIELFLFNPPPDF